MQRLPPRSLLATLVPWLAAGALVAVVAASFGHAQTAPRRAAFEHNCTVVGSGLTDVANRLGRDGWELVSAMEYHGVPPGQAIGLQTQQFLMCFKRAL